MTGFRFVEDRALRRRLEDAPEMARARAQIAGGIAQAATANGRQIARSYRATVVTSGRDVQIRAKTKGIDASGWIEFGTAELPPAAPLRRAVESAGGRLGP